MGDRTVTVLRLAALPVDAVQREECYDYLCAHAIHAAKIHAKFRDFTKRRLVTGEDWRTMQLTPKGRQALDRLS